MDSTQTTPSTQNSSTQTSPFDQIQELEKRENARADKEFSALAKEKEEVMQSISKKEEQAIDELKTDAKKDLKKHSETDVSAILMDAKKESAEECDKLDATYKARKESAVNDLVKQASNPEFLFSTVA